jgi:hypothetical protein
MKKIVEVVASLIVDCMICGPDKLQALGDLHLRGACSIAQIFKLAVVSMF